MHGDLRSRNDSVVLVGLEARVHTTSHRVAGSSKGGLGNGVVLAHESEDDHIAHRSLEFRWRIGETCGTTDLDRMSSSWCCYSTRGTGRNGGGSYGGVCYAGCDCLRDGDGLVDCRCLGVVSRVHPNDYNLRGGPDGNDVATTQLSTSQLST